MVLDLTLPKLDGLDVLKQWRSNNQDVPVLILTARDTLDERIKGIQQGADDYLCKTPLPWLKWWAITSINSSSLWAS